MKNCRILVASIMLLFSAATAQAQKIEYTVDKIWDNGMHCAFTSIEQYKGNYYITFREGETHIFDRNGNAIIEPDEKYVFYTYNHYNDFQEYLNYYGGWGEMFGNITGGGAISSKYNYNPTPYVDVYFGSLSQYENVASVVFILPEVYTKRFFAA